MCLSYAGCQQGGSIIVQIYVLILYIYSIYVVKLKISQYIYIYIYIYEFIYIYDRDDTLQTHLTRLNDEHLKSLNKYVGFSFGERTSLLITGSMPLD